MMAGTDPARRAAIFLDRDGTINEDLGWINDPGVVHLFPGVARALGRFREAGFALVVISNQSGVGRGIVTRDQLDRVNRRIVELIDLEFDRVYSCPHHPTEGHGEFRIACSCRKPGTTMVEQGIAELGLDRARSFLVGDADVDVLCGRAAGLVTVLVLTGHGRETYDKVRSGQLALPDHVAEDLLGAADWIIARIGRELAAPGPASGPRKDGHPSS